MVVDDESYVMVSPWEDFLACCCGKSRKKIEKAREEEEPPEEFIPKASAPEGFAEKDAATRGSEFLKAEEAKAASAPNQAQAAQPTLATTQKPRGGSDDSERAQIVGKMYDRSMASAQMVDAYECVSFGRLFETCGISESEVKRSLAEDANETVDRNAYITFLLDTKGIASKAKVSDDEFDGCVGLFTSITKLKRRHREKLERVFATIDRDHSGGMDADELFQIGQAFNTNFTKAQCVKLFAQIDRDNSGAISVEEFLAMFGDMFESMKLKMKELDKACNNMEKRAQKMSDEKK